MSRSLTIIHDKLAVVNTVNSGLEIFVRTMMSFTSLPTPTGSAQWATYFPTDCDGESCPWVYSSDAGYIVCRFGVHKGYVVSFSACERAHKARTPHTRAKVQNT